MNRRFLCVAVGCIVFAGSTHAQFASTPQWPSDGASGDHFGSSIAVFDGVALIGAPQADVAGTVDSGAAYFLVRQPDLNWAMGTKLVPNDPTANAGFGTSVAISGNRALVGAPLVDSGFVYSFERDIAGTWVQVQKFHGFAGMSDRFGSSVALWSEPGDVATYAWVGAPKDLAPYFATFRLSSVGLFVQSGPSLSTNNGSEFGRSMAMQALRGVVGAPGFDSATSVRSGRALVSESSDGFEWSFTAWLNPPAAIDGDAFGTSVALDGDRVLVGSPGANTTAGNDAGAAYVFERQLDGSWQRVFALIADDEAANNRFGESVALLADTAVVGAPLGDGSGVTDCGAVYVFVRNASGDWVSRAHLEPTLSTSTDDRLGACVAAADRCALGTAPGDASPGLIGSGVTYVYRADCDAPFNYCTSTVHSGGQRAIIGSLGATSVATNQFVLTVRDAMPDRLGLFVYSCCTTQVPFGDGYLCVGGPLHRLGPVQRIDPLGSALRPLDLSNPLAPEALITGYSRWNFQFWYRDPQSLGSGMNLSDALSATFCP